MRPLVGLRRAACARCTGAVALEVEDAVAYGPQLDPLPAAVSVGILVGAFLFRRKIDSAIAARERADAARVELKRARVAILSGEYTGDIAQQEREAEALARQAEDARTITIAGLNVRVMVPLPLGAPAPGATLSLIHI